jgi:nucleotide-binding universal stress UspA family protein
MFKNVLVGVDGTANGRDAIALASRLADPAAKPTLVHVHPGEFHPLHAITPALLAEEEQASLKLLEDERAASDVDGEILSVVAASTGAGLHRVAEENGADLLVVGSCGRSALGRVMIGDDTRAALNGAPCAVAIASRGYAAHPSPLAKVGVAYNSSSESETALASARELAAAGGAAVYALEVVSLPSYAFTGIVTPPLGDSIDAMLAQAKERMGKLQDVHGDAVYGLAGEELAAFGSQVDLLVVGSRGYGPIKRLVLGSTSAYLERHARCSLLVLVRESEAGPVAHAAA